MVLVMVGVSDVCGGLSQKPKFGKSTLDKHKNFAFDGYF